MLQGLCSIFTARFCAVSPARMKGLFKSAGYHLVRIVLLSLIAVSVYAVNASGATLVYSNTLGTSTPLNGPQGVAVDGSGNVYVTDTFDCAIVKYNSSGAYVREFGLPGFGCTAPPGIGGVAVDGSGNIYVADQYNMRIQKFNSSGTYVSTLGVTGVLGSDNSHFYYPNGVAVDSFNNLYVADMYNDRIQKFNSSGAYVSTLGVSGGYGSDNSHFIWPTGVAVDSSGNLYVADMYNDRVQEFNSSGTYVTTLGVTGVSDTDNSHFSGPSGVAVDSSGNVYVADTGNNRIQEFSLSANPGPTNGACGSSNGADLTAAPSTNLCSTGTASSVSGNGPWTWTCAGANGGTTASCTASLLTNGACGSSNGSNLTAAPSTNLCSAGTASSVSGSGPWTWTCSGTNGGSTSPTCTANLLTNGVCGSSSGANLTAAPSTNLCSAGTASSVSGSGPWTWTCSGANNGTNASCTAYLTTQTGTGVLPDTGQTSCVNYSGYGISCAGTGQDGAYILHPMSYTDNKDGTVTDNVTGLMWEQQSGTNMSGSNAGTYCTALSVGKHTDWRLPSVMELISIVNYGIQSTGPMINSTYFLNTAASPYWSSTPDAGNTGNAWSLNFSAGTVFSNGMSGNAYVRCVRGGQLEVGNFTDNKDGTVSDSATGLMWQQAEGGSYQWGGITNVGSNPLVEALTYCTGLSLGGHSDWRLPNIKELASIMDYAQSNPAINTTFFPNASANFYWSSTPNATFASIAWGVIFGINGGVTYSAMGDSYDVRCVRGGQSGASGNLVLSISEAGTGSGTVTSSPSGISCGTTCSASYSSGTSVTLTATPASGSTFTGWSGGGCSGTGTCSVTMTATTSVTATFSKASTCSESISSSNATLSSGANSGSVSVTASSSSCTWTATSNVSWITITSGSSGTGSGTVSYSVSANTSSSSQTGTITIAGQTFSVTQAGLTACTNLPVILAVSTPVYYPTLQSAYNAAVSGDTIESQTGTFTEDLNFNSNVSVILEGGYNCGYSANSSYSVINGTLTISGGPVTVGYIKIQ